MQAANFNFSVVAYSGQPAVGAPAGTYSVFSPKPALGDDGKVCYAAQISGAGPNNPVNGLWSADANGTSVFLLAGDAAPDAAAGTTFVDIINEKIVANGASQAAFLALVDPPDATSSGLRGIWAGSPANLRLAALQGQPAPGTSSTFTGSFDYIALNDAGQIAFDDRFEGNVRYGIWMGIPGVVLAVALKGEQAPGFANGVTFNGANSILALNNNGLMAFNFSVSSGREVIWFGSPNNIAPVVVTGQAAPGTTDTFNDLSSAVDINDNGEIGFRASILPSNTEGIWFGAPNNLALIAQRGTTSPDLPTDFFIKGFAAWPIINDHNQIAFLAGVGTSAISASSESLWLATSGSLDLIAREGDQPPGFPVGTTIVHFENIHLNNRGQVAFDGQYTGTVAGTAIFATDGTSTPQLVAKVGDQVVAGGVLKTFSGVSLFAHSNGGFGRLVGSSDGRSSSFNDNGDLMFNATFAGGGSGIIKSNIPAVQANNPPQITLGDTPIGAEGQSLAFNATFTDADAGDTHSATIDWGDGTSSVIDPATSPINASHVYADSGNYTVQLTVVDNAGASVQKSLTAVVVAVCDVNQDGSVSKSDISIISKSLRKTVPVGTTGDINRDGRITTQDTRECTRQCSLPNCAEPAA